MTASSPNYEDPGLQAAHAASLDVFDTLPRSIRVAAWCAVLQPVGIDLARRFIALDGISDEEAAARVVASIRRDDSRAVWDQHYAMGDAGGSAHVLAQATILRDAGAPPRRTPLRYRRGRATSQFHP